MNLKILLIILAVVSISSITLVTVANATTNDPNNTVAGIPKNSHDIDVLMLDIGLVEITCPNGLLDDRFTKARVKGGELGLIKYDWRTNNTFEKIDGQLSLGSNTFANIYVIDGIIDQNENYFIMVWGIDTTRAHVGICAENTYDEMMIVDVIGKCDGSRMDIISRDSLGFNMTNITDYHAGCVA